jgi:hypothetical protein
VFSFDGVDLVDPLGYRDTSDDLFFLASTCRSSR